MIFSTKINVFIYFISLFFSQAKIIIVKGFLLPKSKVNVFFGKGNGIWGGIHKKTTHIRKMELIPEENKSVDPNRLSLSKVPYKSVLLGLKELYPPQGLSERNAISRTDGYWSYIKKGEEVPQHLTYGEFDFLFFCELLDRAHHHYFNGEDRMKGWEGKIFVDVGSGTGRLVIGAAALHPGFSKCKGLEILNGIHEVALKALEKCNKNNKSFQAGDANENFEQNNTYVLCSPQNPDVDSPSMNGSVELPLAPIDFCCGSFEDPNNYIGDADIAFVTATCMSEEIMDSLSRAFGRQCKPGTIIITTDYQLPLEGYVDAVNSDQPSGQYKHELLEKIDGWCWITGGESTAYIHRVV